MVHMDSVQRVARTKMTTWQEKLALNMTHLVQSQPYIFCKANTKTLGLKKQERLVTSRKVRHQQ